MKEFVIKEIKPGKYKYGYKIQKLDIELMMELGIEVPNKFKEIYKEGFKEKELREYVYFYDSVTREFIRRQYYIRDNVEISNMNEYELDVLLSFYNQRLQNLNNLINIIKDKDLLNDLKVNINILINEMLGVVYLKDNLIKIIKK